jgi:hypothetical protein
MSSRTSASLEKTPLQRLNLGTLAALEQLPLPSKLNLDDDVSTHDGLSTRRTSSLSSRRTSASSTRSASSPDADGSDDAERIIDVSASLPGAVGSDDICLERQECSSMSFSNEPLSPTAIKVRKMRRFARMIGDKAGFQYRTVRDVFMAADVNGDGMLSAADMVAIFQTFQLSADAAEELFALMQPAGNSHVKWCEFMTVAGPVFAAHDPSKQFAYLERAAPRHWRRIPSMEGQRLRVGW